VHDRSLVARKLAAHVLEKGAALPLALLLELLVDTARLRDLARELGVSPKGFRADKAPAKVLASTLAEQRDATVLDRVVQLLVPERSAASGAEPADAQAGEAQPSAPALASLRDAELARVRAELERCRESSSRALARNTELSRQLEEAEQQIVALKGQAAASRASPSVRGEPRSERELERRIHDLENEREGFREADRAVRVQLAYTQSRVRELEAALAAAEAQLPKGKRRNRPPAEPMPSSEDRPFRVPRFTAAFYKSLEGKDRKAVERAVHAVLLFCTEGHAYPGLEVKQLGGQDTWSLRASLGLRVYFRHLDNGDIELLELANREDQHTTLRRLKEKER
jgi:hypothetical protein